jgi:hypothetical protein
MLKLESRSTIEAAELDIDTVIGTVQITFIVSNQDGIERAVLVRKFVEGFSGQVLVPSRPAGESS